MSDTISSSSDDSNTYVERTTTNIFARIGGAIAGAAFGVILFLVAIGVLFWNESRAVDAIRGLSQAAKVLVEASPSPINGAQDRHLVHLTGQLATHGALSDPEMNLTRDNLVHLMRKVEMFQWKEEKESRSSSQLGGGQTTQTTTTYKKVWSDGPINSSSFKGNHRNPEMTIRSQIFTAPEVTMAERKLSARLLDELGNYQPIAAPATVPEGYTVSGQNFYRGDDPEKPAIGDLRVSFSGVPAQTVSVLAEQRGPLLAPFKTNGGYGVSLIVPGDVDADQMLADKSSQEKVLTWILRGVGFLCFVLALALIAMPLGVLADVLPFLGSIVGGGIVFFALFLAIPLTLLTIGIAWVVVRPLLGLGLIAAAVLGVIAFYRLRPRRQVRFLPAGLNATR